MSDEPKKHRFLTMSQAAEELNVNQNQIRALTRTGELCAMQIGARGYLVRLLGWMKPVATFTGQARRRQRELSARYVRIVERRCAVVGA